MSSAWKEIKELHKQTTLGAKEGVAFRYFSRPLASFILYFIRNGRITPNQVTILSLVVALAGTVFQAVDLTWRGLLVGGALFMLAHMLDALDGQLARLRKAGSVIGMYFDFFIDELKAYFIFVSIAVRLYRQALEGSTPLILQKTIDTLNLGPEGVLWIGLAGLLGLSIGISCTQFVKRAEWKEAFPPGEGGGAPSPLARLIRLVEKVGSFIIDYPSYILILCVLDHVEIYYLGYAFIVCVYAARALTGISLKLWRVNPYT